MLGQKQAPRPSTSTAPGPEVDEIILDMFEEVDGSSQVMQDNLLDRITEVMAYFIFPKILQEEKNNFNPFD